MDRLFVPMCTRQFRSFQNRGKTWEVRRRGRQWTKQFVRQGRTVELRCGYGKTNKVLWGTIGLVYETYSASLETARLFTFWEFFGEQAVVPMSTKIDLIAFEVILNKK
jgi:hypothetical protein